MWFRGSRTSLPGRVAFGQKMTSKLSKSISLPGLYKIGTDQPKGFSGNARKTTLGFKTAGNLKSAVDLKRSPEATERSRNLASLLKTGGWRTCYREEEEGPVLQDWAAFTLKRH